MASIKYTCIYHLYEDKPTCSNEILVIEYGHFFLIIIIDDEDGIELNFRRPFIINGRKSIDFNSIFDVDIGIRLVCWHVERLCVVEDFRIIVLSYA
jgi:hypothetical protein